MAPSALLSLLLVVLPSFAAARDDFIDRFPHLVSPEDYTLLPDGASETPVSLGDVTSIAVNATHKNQVDVVCGTRSAHKLPLKSDDAHMKQTDAQVRVQFWSLHTVRVWVSWDGNFTDEATGDIVTGSPSTTVTASLADKGAFYEITATDPAAATTIIGSAKIGSARSSAKIGSVNRGGGQSAVLQVTKSPLRLALLDSSGRLLWNESAPLSRNSTSCFQSLAPLSPSLRSNSGSKSSSSLSSSSSSSSSSAAAAAEAFFGGGMQNGRLVHTGTRIRISKDYNWADGGNPNSVPLYLSSNGYAVYRNTWAPGYYDFGTDGAVSAGHNESDRFDAFYFVADQARDFKSLLAEYTDLTGAPFMPPIYALGLGDSDCYHNTRHGNNTRVVTAVADQYREYDMPASWFLPNDGYGCGFGVGDAVFPKNFTELDATVADLHVRGFQTGLWSSTGLPNITREVAGSGTRIAKTDVGWIGAGYKYAMDALKLLTHGIEDNSDGRRFIWTVEGWAGTHRYAVMWAGDDTGSHDYIRWQIPTFAGTSFSAMPHVSGDIDGIFGGSPETYVRDLQFKSLMTTIMVMSGWAANPDKQPWTWGEPYTSINRMYLKLKAALTPFHYTLSRVAYDTGVPPVRAMALEFPSDDSLLVNSTGSAMQFMVGGDLLVAPQHNALGKGGDSRDGIYLPANPGGWIDYWTGDACAADSKSTTINGYPTPLETLPLFVRAGAIIPMWPAGLPLKAGNATTPPPDTMILDIFPEGNSSFELYEDDGVTRKALESEQEWARTTINVVAGENAMKKGGRLTVTVGEAEGKGFDGQLSERKYDVRIHRRSAPPEFVTIVEGNISLPELHSLDAVRYAGKLGSGGWYYSRATLGGVLHIAVPPQSTSKVFSLLLSDGPLYPYVSCVKCGTAKRQTFDYVNSVTPGNLGGKISERGSNPLLCVTVSSFAKDPDSGTPAIQMQPCSPTLDSSQVWVLDPKNQWLTLRGDTSGQCIDLDMSDHNLEMYHCNPSVISHQQFAYDKSSGAFTTLADNSCMTIEEPTSSRTGGAESARNAAERRKLDVKIAQTVVMLEELQQERLRLY